MPKISAVIITYNEQDYIQRCIKSVKSVADEILVVDSFSTDNTGVICKELGVRFVEHAFEGYREQKNFAMKLAQNDYILSLDADEALSEELAASVLAVKENWICDGYYTNRLNNYCGEWIRHSNWYPDRKLRLFDRRKGEWKGINPHDRFILNTGASHGKLKGDILHWVINTYEEHVDKSNKFSTIAAQEYYKLGVKSSIFKIILHPTWRFFKSYILRRGFLDGYNGFVICFLSAHTSALKYIKLRHLILDERKRRKPNNTFDVKIAN